MRTYQALTGFIGVLTRLFFRRIEVVGLENVPARGGGLLVSWHPNGVVDPALILGSFPRQVVFGARHGLFRIPVFGALMRAIGTVPIRRAGDAGTGDEAKRRAANDHSLHALAEAIASGSFSALFPEGVSHDDSELRALRFGAARLFDRALALSRANPGAPAPVIVPVGLHYDNKAVFRSRALIAYHRPLELPSAYLQPLAADASPQECRARYEAVTTAIEEGLRSAVHPTESWRLNRLMHHTAALMRAERAQRADARPGSVSMEERAMGMARVWTGYEAHRRRDPAATASLVERIDAYVEALEGLGLKHHELDRAPRLLPPGLVVLLALQAVMVYLLFPPLLFAGYLINGPSYWALRILTRVAVREDKGLASVKLMAGVVLFPATWALAGFGVAYGVVHVPEPFAMPVAPVAAGLVTSLLGAIGGWVALRYLELAKETRRAVRVRLYRRRRAAELQRLRDERAALFDALSTVSADLDLPGVVRPDGKIVAAERPVPT